MYFIFLTLISAIFLPICMILARIIVVRVAPEKMAGWAKWVLVVPVFFIIFMISQSIMRWFFFDHDNGLHKDNNFTIYSGDVALQFDSSLFDSQCGSRILSDNSAVVDGRWISSSKGVMISCKSRDDFEADYLEVSAFSKLGKAPFSKYSQAQIEAMEVVENSHYRVISVGSHGTIYEGVGVNGDTAGVRRVFIGKAGDGRLLVSEQYDGWPYYLVWRDIDNYFEIKYRARGSIMDSQKVVSFDDQVVDMVSILTVRK